MFMGKKGRPVPPEEQGNFVHMCAACVDRMADELGKSVGRCKRGPYPTAWTPVTKVVGLDALRACMLREHRAANPPAEDEHAWTAEEEAAYYETYGAAGEELYYYAEEEEEAPAPEAESAPAPDAEGAPVEEKEARNPAETEAAATEAKTEGRPAAADTEPDAATEAETTKAGIKKTRQRAIASIHVFTTSHAPKYACARLGHPDGTQ